VMFVVLVKKLLFSGGNHGSGRHRAGYQEFYCRTFFEIFQALHQGFEFPALSHRHSMALLDN